MANVKSALVASPGSSLIPSETSTGGAPASPTTISEPDSLRFGVRIARNPSLTHDTLAEANEFCLRHDIDLMIARCATEDSFSMHSLEADGFRLMDTLVSWRRSLDRPAPAEHTGQENGTLVQPIGPVDEAAVRRIAAQAFQGYSGHYHADPRLDQHQASEVYISWATRCCREPDSADLMLGARRDGELVGFLALKALGQGLCMVPLAAVAPQTQGQGVLRSLLVGAVRWLKEHNYTAVEYGCVLTNIAAQKALARAGFEMCRSAHTLHKWYDRPLAR